MIKQSAMTLAQSADGNPAQTAAVASLLYMIFNLLEAAMDMIMFGNMSTHRMYPLFASAFIAYAAYAVYACALYNSSKGA